MRLLIIDGHALIFRAYFAFQTANLKNSITGKPSGAVFGFFRMFFKILQDYSPSHVAMTFDPGTPLERSKVYDLYKANRNPMPEDLKPQVGEIIDISREIGFKLLQIPGHEADDIIGTLSRLYGNGKNEILIFSGDKDLYQLLNQNIKMLRGKKGATEFLEIDVAWVESEIGVKPEQIVDYMGIVGDTSDNIPGVKGIGEKGAGKLISEYGNLESIYENIDSIKNPSMKTKLLESKDNAFLSRQLATLKLDLDLEWNLDDLILPSYLKPERVEVFKKRGYNVLFRDLVKESQKAGFSMDSLTDESESKKDSEAKTPEASKGEYLRIKDLQSFKKLMSDLKKSKVVSIDTETTSPQPMFADLLGISFSAEEGKGYYLSISHPNSLFNTDSFTIDEIRDELIKLTENKNVIKVGQNIKYDAIVFEKYGIGLYPIGFDTMLASYVLHPESRRHNMDDLAEDYLSYKTITYDDLTGKGKKRLQLYEIDPDRVCEYASEDADITLRLYNKLSGKIKEIDSNTVLETIEIPLIPVLKSMEMHGVSIDTKHFSKLDKQFRDRIERLVSDIHSSAGETFNINSTKELQVILFDKLGLTKLKKTQTGYSTDHSVLEQLQGEHEIIDYILEHRKYTKLLSTYIETLPLLIHPKTGRIHTSYNQTVAVTGRLSSADPNLQNIPIRDTEGKLIRKGFVPGEKDFELLSLDYSQIELRIMAHMCGDKNMIDAYQNNLDIHARTASALFSIEESKVSSDMRARAKAVNFSVIYGSTAFGLAQNMKISRTEAGMFIDKYFVQYPGVKQYMEDIYKFALENGFVETLTGRRRYIPEIKSTKRQELEAAKRIAINSPIQGTSADMIKLAMIRIHEKFQKKKLRSKMVMQVHDELVFEVHVEEKEEVYKLAKKEMENVIRLNVPVIVSGKFGKNWDEAH
ncbi:MAG: DNA polymerase I [Leptospiraceae bacterium]|nr:DNA polymerase I [Leptospiraceae bacterium]MCP5513118.1 DNA polymerase I [Leptospiraceae bacterium]